MTHYLTASTAFSCDSCQKSFERKDDLQKHQLDAHSYFVYSCKICNDMFDSKGKIQVNNQFLVDSRMSCCKILVNFVSTKWIIFLNFSHQIHFVTKHSNELKVFKCSACPPTMSNLYHSEIALATHIKNIHINVVNNVPPFVPFSPKYSVSVQNYQKSPLHVSLHVILILIYFSDPVNTDMCDLQFDVPQ